MAITVIGTVFVDLKAYPYGALVRGEKNPGYTIEVHGGVGRNIAENLAVLGENVRLVSLVDHSGTALKVIEHLNRIGVDTRFVKKTGSGMGKWVAVFDENGGVAASVSVRPCLDEILDIFDSDAEAIFKDGSVVIEPDIGDPVVEKAIYYASKYNTKVYSLASAMCISPKQLEFIKKSECYICNLDEAGMLFGFNTQDFQDTEQLRETLFRYYKNSGFKKLIVTLGASGSLWFDGDESGHCPANDVKCVDAAGAGDAFASGAFAALAADRTLREACASGTDAASRVIRSRQNVLSLKDGTGNEL